jgi:hypothetical protein
MSPAAIHQQKYIASREVKTNGNRAHSPKKLHELPKAISDKWQMWLDGKIPTLSGVVGPC